MIKDKLLECGIHSDAIEVITDEQEATTRGLELAGSGDLVLVLGDKVKRAWKQIIYFKPGEDVLADAPPATAIEIPQEFFGEFEFDEDMELIRDERGVRIAREAED